MKLTDERKAQLRRETLFFMHLVMVSPDAWNGWLLSLTDEEGAYVEECANEVAREVIDKLSLQLTTDTGKQIAVGIAAGLK